VQERGPLQADLDERGLHAGHDPLHAALVDVAHHAAPPAALDVQLLQHAVLDHGHSRLARGDVDQDLFRHGCPHPDTGAATPSVTAPATASSRAAWRSGRPMTPE